MEFTFSEDKTKKEIIKMIYDCYNQNPNFPEETTNMKKTK